MGNAKKKKKSRKGSRTEQWCDSCGRKFVGSGKVRKLPLSGGGGVYLCKRCWEKEMEWRKERNKELSPGNRFPIRKWPGK